MNIFNFFKKKKKEDKFERPKNIKITRKEPVKPDRVEKLMGENNKLQ